ncbi:MAG: substrate-binding domain-containing protein [Cyclobacteriaceae bacterium]
MMIKILRPLSRHLSLIFLPIILALAGCSRNSEPTAFTIGFSQCTMNDSWRQQMVREMYRELAVHPQGEVKLIVKDAVASSDRQIEDIAGLIETGVDALIISPLEDSPLIPVISRARQRGIPVILIDRKIDSDQYDCFIGADNVAIGLQAGELIASSFDEGLIIEVQGLEGSSPSTERSKGFNQGLEINPYLQVIQYSGDWTEVSGYRIAREQINEFKNCTAIFSHNDFMARGIYDALQEQGLGKPIYGVDGLYGEGNGLGMVREGHLKATFHYPTGGAEAIQASIEFIKRQKTDRHIELATFRIDSANVNELIIQELRLLRQTERVDDLIIRLDARDQQIIKFFTISASLLLVIGFLTFKWWSVSQNQKIDHDRIVQSLKQISLSSKDSERLPTIDAIYSHTGWIRDVTEFLEIQYTNPDLKVGDVASEFAMSESSFYRKLKKSSGKSYTSIITSIRLENAARLLVQSDFNIDQVAFECGFSDPKHFSKVFSKKYGVSPSEFRRFQKD